MKTPNLTDYIKLYANFNWQQIRDQLSGLDGGKGLNIAHEAIDRHAASELKDTVAIRLIRKAGTREEFTYGQLKIQTSKVANVLKNLGLKKGDRVFSLLGRVPELYLTALGALKYQAVFCPLF